jgi:LysM repeat protein
MSTLVTQPPIGEASTRPSASIWSSTDMMITTTTPPTGTQGNQRLPTPTPHQTGMIANCNAFHLVVSGDQCNTIVAEAGISLAQFYDWNPAVGNSCAQLYLDNYVCIGVAGQTSPTPSKALSAIGIATPTPYQAGLTAHCGRFHLVVSGDYCAAVAEAAGISLDQFYQWNPAVRSTCSDLYLGYYVCIGLE